MRKPIQILAILAISFLYRHLNAQVTVINDGILTIADSQLVRINGDFSNYSTEFSNRGDLGLTGNFLTEARIVNPEAGILRFIGLQTQNIAMYDTLELFNVELNNPAGLSLEGISHTRIFGNMDFLDGIVDTDSTLMLTFHQGATTTNGSDFSHINGPAKKYGDNNFIFPVGKQGDYRPAGISDIESSSVYQIEYLHYPYFNFTREFEIHKVNDEGFWNLDRLEGTAFPKLMLSYDESTNIFTSSDDLHNVFWDDQWKLRLSETDGASPMTSITTQEKIGDFGFYTTSQRRVDIPDIVDYSIIQNEDCEIVIDWIMPPGTLIGTYEIEVSYDSLDFVYTGEVEGSLEVLQNYRTYRFVDRNLHDAEKIYYRIKMTTTGPWPIHEYSPVLSIENDCIFEDCKIYPNPLNSEENLNFQILSEVGTEMPLQIWDALGRLMFEQTIVIQQGQYIYEINTKDYHLPSGTYFLSVNPRKSLKFVVIKD